MGGGGGGTYCDGLAMIGVKTTSNPPPLPTERYLSGSESKIDGGDDSLDAVR